MFHTVLVANRGEIARRVIRTLERLGIRSIAVYSDADAGAPTCARRMPPYRIGPAAAALSYLNTEAILAAARESGAQAIHPGYGFLSENAAFARSCAEAGIVFIGPGERALDVMGDKIRSKAHVTRRGVPVVPGIDAAGLTDDEIADAAAGVGYPLLIKPSAGGGGKGMQIVREAAALPEALAAARRVAAAAFGDDTLLLERLIERPRHIEVQVIADADGAVLHLGERECTLQRRHQKVIEEAPSPIVDAATRERLGAAACAAAASVDYRGAGTVEFLVAAARPDEFFFIEMNTRLQVEHPVTELVTGLDLVELQLRVAAGQPLGISQEDVRLTGHAIEARVYAESPERGFVPATGDVLAGARPPVRTCGSARDRDRLPRQPGLRPDDREGHLLGRGSRRGAGHARRRARGDGGARARHQHRVPAGAAGGCRGRAGDLDTGLIDRMPTFVAPAYRGGARRRGRRRGARLGATPDGAAPDRNAAASDSGVLRPAGARPASPRLVGTSSRPRPGRSSARARPNGEPVGMGDRAAGRPSRSAGARGHPHSPPTRTAGPGCTRRRVPSPRTLTRREAIARRLAEPERDTAAAHPELFAPMPGAVVAVHVADGAAVARGSGSSRSRR